MQLTQLAHQYLEQHLTEGALAIDATAGNGHDTLKMAQLVGVTGTVISMDIQAEAIDSTKQRLDAANIANSQLDIGDHAEILQGLCAEHAAKASAITFNLGYLPGSDKSIQTTPSSTLKALNASLEMLSLEGVLLVTAYRGHEGGMTEAGKVEQWMHNQKNTGCQIESHEPKATNRIPPILWVLHKAECLEGATQPMHETLTVRPSTKPRHVFTTKGDLLAVPEGWALLLPGDAAVSRRIKQEGPTWIVKEKKGRKEFSRGIWAPADRIEALQFARKIEKEDPSYTQKLEAGRARRAQQEVIYAEDFTQALRDFLNFHPRYQMLAGRLAELISAHATPVGSGTVARTKRIPVEERAQAATIAWLRHQTTAYDNMHIPIVKGARREVRHLLAQKS
ncbi:MAG: DUF2293 domain-containing protein, partial [Lentimonas sp.]